MKTYHLVRQFMLVAIAGVLSFHLLLDRKAIISQFDYLGDRQPDSEQYTDEFNPPAEREESDRNLPEFLIYKIVESDTNGNGKRDRDDAELGYLSTLSGKNLQLITPKDTKLIEWEYDIRVKTDVVVD